MAQVVEVRFINEATEEKLHDCFTLAKSHEEALRLALSDWSGGAGVMKSFTKASDATWVKAGTNSCWRYAYRCVLEEDEDDREVLAVLFSAYKERIPQITN